MRARAWLMFPFAALLGCAGTAPTSNTTAGDLHPPMAAATGVARADGAKGPRDPRVIPLRPMSGDVEILFGNPEVAGEPFVMRIRELPGTIVPPHSHPVDENITVVQGTWYFGQGESFDTKALEELKPGAYAFAPKGTWMFGYAPEEVVVQVHGTGPFHIRWRNGLKTLDDPDAKSTFRFSRGQRVLAVRGSGLIVEGYASGTIIQYEIEAPGGARFMATESEIRPQ